MPKPKSKDALSDRTGKQFTPYITSQQTLPEITPRAILLGIFLAILLATSTTFMGLKFARTISGSIPAALISMLILRRLKQSTILENNMVQTIASAGEAVAAGVIYTLPALIIISFWDSFNYFQTTVAAILGAVLGICISVPLRRVMIVEDHMPYPEGLATAEVLITGDGSKINTKPLVLGSFLAAFVSFLQSGLKISADQLSYWTKIGSTGFGASLSLSSVMLASGYIVGLAGLISFIVGAVATWLIGIPIFIYVYGFPVDSTDVSSAFAMIQKANFRFMGVGILAIGGIWGVISLSKQIARALRYSFKAMKKRGAGSEFSGIPRTERDIPFKYLIAMMIGIAVLLFILFFSLLNHEALTINSPTFYATVIFATLFSIIISFICTSIAAYIVGIVGTTSLPLSGVMIVATIAFSSIFLFLLKADIDFSINSVAALKVTSIVIIFASMICVAAGLGGDNMQDLKAGYVVGATPWKQQLMLMIGAVTSAGVIPFILQTTFDAYGIGDILPHAGMDPSQSLSAPQATLLASISSGFFIGKLPWSMIQIGLLIGAIAIVIDEYLKYTHSKFRFPPMLLALGFYLPLGLVMSFTVGGIINNLVKRKLHTHAELSETSKGILFASGLIAGETILSTLLTIPFSYYKSTDVFALRFPFWTASYQNMLGLVLYLLIALCLYKIALVKKR